MQTYSVYVCRAVIDGINVSGHTKKYEDKIVCTVALQSHVKTHHAFDILINKGLGAKLTWKTWNKFSGSLPTGAVGASSVGHVRNYIT